MNSTHEDRSGTHAEGPPGVDGRPSRGRVAYADAGRAQRHARRAARDAGASPFQRDVLAVVVDLTASYSKMTDYVALGVLVDELGLADTARSRERVGQALAALRDAGVVEYRPGQGRSLSLIGLPPAPAEPVDNPASTAGVRAETPPTSQGGTSPTSQGGTSPTSQGGTTEELTRGVDPRRGQDRPTSLRAAGPDAPRGRSKPVDPYRQQALDRYRSHPDVAAWVARCSDPALDAEWKRCREQADGPYSEGGNAVDARAGVDHG